MADLTANRAGWTGLLMAESVVTVTATSSAGERVGPATPATGNLGRMQLRAATTSRPAAVDDVEIEVTGGGQALGEVPVEVVSYLGTDAVPYGWMDPCVAWGATTPAQNASYSRQCRWGGQIGYTLDYADSADASITDRHDICPAVEDGRALIVAIDVTASVYVIVSRWYERALAPSTAVATASQVIDLSVLGPTTHDIYTVRAATWNGSAVLVICARESGDKQRIYQWGSVDGGMSWAYVGSTEDTAADEPAEIGDLETTPNGIMFAWASHADTGGEVRVGLLASPFTPIWEASYETVGTDLWDDASASLVQDLEVALCAAETGEVYLVALTVGTIPVPDVYGKTWRTRDGGKTWKLLRGSLGNLSWLHVAAASVRPENIDATWCRGQIIWTGLVTSDRRQIRLGGWSQYAATSPVFGTGAPIRGYGLASSVAWHRMYLPWDTVPSSQGWTRRVNSAVTESMASGTYLRLEGSGATRIEESWTAGGSESAHDRFVQRALIEIQPNVTLVDQDAPAFVEFTANNGAKTYGVRIGIGNNNLRAYQRTGASTWSALAAASSHSLTGVPAMWLIHVEYDFDTGKVWIYARGRDSTDPIALDGMAWSVAVDLENLSVTDIAAHETTTTVVWGSFLKATEVCDWYQTWILTDADSSGVAPAPPTAALVQGRPLTGPAVHVAPDVLLLPGPGIAYDGDSWTVSSTWEHPPANVTDSDPGRVWRSGDQLATTLTATLERPVGGPLVGVTLRGLVAEEVTVEVQDTAGTWTEILGSGDHVTSLNATRKGGVFQPNAPYTSNPLWLENELAGWWLVFDDKARQVLDNRGGRWAAAGSSAPPHIRLGSTTGIGATVGAIDLYPQDLTVIATVGAAVIQAVRVTIAAADHGWPSDQLAWQLQRLIVGAVLVTGDDPDWASSSRTEVRTRSQEAPNGRLLGVRATLPPRREVEVAWADGVDTTQAFGSAAPAWISTAAGEDPVADVGSTPYALEGALRRIKGEAGEVVLFRAPMGAPTETTPLVLTRRHQFVHGRVTSVVAMDGAQGEEGGDQVIRVGTLSVREEV